MKGITADALLVALDSDISHLIVHENAPEEGVRSFACRALRDSLMKKFISRVDPEADNRALAKFLAVNERLSTWTLSLKSLEDELLFNEFKSIVHKFLNPSGQGNILFDSLDLTSGAVGPGKSLGSDHNNFYSKLFDSSLTFTDESLYGTYATLIARYPLWLEAEENRIERRGIAKKVEGNRLCFVPKHDDISRVICIEPVLNMFFQQAARHSLEDRLRQFFGIDFAYQQEKNRELAQLGSERSLRDRTGFNSRSDYATIDLSSASDSIGLRMLEQILDPISFEVLKMFRSPVCRLPDGSAVCLNMVSTMGNAFTFPLQTFIFASVVTACARVSGLQELYESSGFCKTFLVSPHGSRLGTFSVFGDDIICPSVIAGKVIRLLNILGFEVNADKTFLEGPFRESCGSDFFRGQNVRGVYCRSLATPQDFYSLINRLNVWSFKNRIPLRRTVRLLLSRCPRFEVPPWEADDCGIKIPLTRYLAKPIYRQGSFAYKRWVPKVSKIRIDTEKEVIFVPRGGKPILYNRTGLYLSFLQGVIRNGSITVRHDSTRYVTKWGIAPNWCESPTMKNPFKGSFGGQDLESLAYITIS